MQTDASRDNHLQNIWEKWSGLYEYSDAYILVNGVHIFL